MTENKVAKKNTVIVLSIILVLIVVASLAARLYLFTKEQSLQEQSQQLVGLGFYKFEQPRILSDVPMLNLQGEAKSFTQHLSGWRLVNFGYMFCPDICPINLALLHAVKTEWDKQANAPALKVLHVTFDPARDTPELLKEYLNYMDPSFYGLTGELEDIQRLSQQLSMVFRHEKANKLGHYFISHSDAMALINPQGKYVGLFKGPYQKANMIQVLNLLLMDARR
ncbi:MAG: protein SCO1/2 [Kiritimatiellia bacterium]|jgi:protein SCO1/2